MGKKASERSITYACAGSPVKKGRVKSTTILEFGFIMNAINATVWNRDSKTSVVYADLTFAGKDSVRSAAELENLSHNREQLRHPTESLLTTLCQAENGPTTKGPPCSQTRNAKGYEFVPAVYDQTLIGLME